MAKAKAAESKKLSIQACSSAAKMGALGICDPSRVVLASRDNRICGLSIPFAFEYLLDCNVFPLGTCMEISGESDSNKTTFLFELGRMFYEQGGWLDLTLTENKYSPDLAHSVMGWPTSPEDVRLVINASDTMDMWQKMLTSRIGAIKKFIKQGAKIKLDPDLFERGKKKKGEEAEVLTVPPGAYYPVLFGIDSIMGQVLESTTKNVDQKGASGRGFAVEAGSLTVFLKSLSTKVRDWPFSVVYINHGKVSKIDEYSENYNTPGGNQTKFQATYRIRAKRSKRVTYIESDDRKALYRHAYFITLSMYKSSLGQGYRNILLPMTWSYDLDEQGRSLQKTVFDWAAALVYIITSEHARAAEEGVKKEEKTSMVRKLDEVVHVRQVDSAYIPTKVQSKEYMDGAVVSPSELGRWIQSDPEKIKGLRQLWGIKEYTPWDRRVDYFKLSRLLKDRAAIASTSTPE